MRLIGHVFKTIVGIVSSIAAVVSSGCIKSEEVKCYYGPAPVETAEQEQNDIGDPELVPSARDIEEEPLDVYGPPPFEADPIDEVEEVPTTIYGPPEAFNREPELPQPELMDSPKIVAYYGPLPDDSKDSIQPNTIKADLLVITPEDDHRCSIKLRAGKKDGVVVGAVGTLYINNTNETVQFTVTNVQNLTCIATVNASLEQLKKTTKAVIHLSDTSITPQPLPKDEGKVIALYGVSPVPPVRE
ncbi:MAG: hypothetical protein J6A01_11755 [Proteobacteria bacterium]|nr:hypothetical protein [Pseudomonadota bacterium]